MIRSPGEGQASQHREQMTFHASRAQFYMGDNELVIQWDQMSPSDPVGPSLIMYLSWTHAKKIAKILGDHIEIYEKMFGRIPDGTVSAEGLAELTKKGIVVQFEQEKAAPSAE